MRFFRYDGPNGMLVGFGLVQKGTVYRVPSSHAAPVLANPDFKELKGKDAPADAILIVPDVGYTPQGERGEPPPGSPETQEVTT